MVAKSNFLFGAALALTGAHAPVIAEDTYPDKWVSNAERLPPISNWALDYAEDNCRLARLFGTEEDQHLLFIEQAWPRNGFSLTAAGSSFRRYRRGGVAFVGLQNDVPMRRIELPPTARTDSFGPTIILNLELTPSAEESAPSPGASANADDDSQRAQGIAGLDTVEGTKINRVIFRRPTGKPVSFETGNLEAAFRALNACTSDLLQEWGLDPAKHQSFTRANWLNQEQIVPAILESYPSKALSRGEQAIFRMRVIIEEDGGVSDCQISAATIAEGFGSPACAEMQAARFSPALDEEGNPMRSFFATTVSYRINE